MNKNYVSVFESGYIISADGVIESILDDERHPDAFARFLRANRNDEEFLNNPNYELCVIRLLEMNQVIYVGIKKADADKASEGILYLPEKISSKQSIAVEQLINDKKMFVHGNEGVELAIASVIGGKRIEMTKKETLEMIRNSK